MQKATLFVVALALLATAVAGTTVNPAASNSYLNNGLSGMYKWLGGTVAPIANRDAYTRFHWRELEPSQGVYDLSGLENLLNDAKKNYGGKAGFRIMVVDTYEGGKGIPDYFATSANGWTCKQVKNTWVPNWNGAALLTRITALVDAIAAKYANDARLSWVDIGIYGNYGEWHNAELRDAGCFPGPNGWGDATLARKKAFIDLVVSRFPKQFVVLNTNDFDGMCIALAGTRIGLRGDTFSDNTWTSELPNNDPLYELIRRQYRAAPFVSEFSTSPDFTKAKQQALEDHRVNVGNGNFPYWSDQSTEQKNALIAASKFIGPRIRVVEATWTSSVAPGGCLTVKIVMANDGSARVYEKWNTVVQLRKTGATAASWQSGNIIDIRNVLPTNDGVASWTETNSFTVPTGLAMGTYDVVLAVVDPTKYRPNFLLSISARNSDNTYTLGTISIASGTIPDTCTTRTPSYRQPKYAIGPGVNSWNDHPLGPIYTDFLFWGWEPEPNGATGKVNNASPVWGGSRSISFTTQRAWGIYGFRFVCTIDITGYKYIHFRMRAAASGSGEVFMYPYKAPWNNPASVDLANYGGSPTAGGWKNYNIPLSAFPGLPKTITHIVFGGYNEGATFYIDDISFSDNVVA